MIQDGWYDRRGSDSTLKMMVGTCVVRLIGTEEVVDQMILFSHYVSSSASPTSMLMMIHVKEYHLMMVGT